MASAKNAYRFEVLRQLGQGGMGEVFLARDRANNRAVALKCLAPSQGAQARGTLRAEVKILAALKHPNLIQVYDYFPTAGDVIEAHPDFPFSATSPCYTMEFLEGRPLDALPQPVDASTALSIFQQLSAGLAYLHRRRILHRDLKPSNVIQSPSGEVKLLDFGLAATDFKAHSTGPVGTLAYLPPEAFWGEYLPLSDLFSFGVLYYELLTGRLPYPKALSQTQGLTPPHPLLQMRDDLPEPLANLVDRMIRLSPGERPASAQALLRYLPEHGVSLPIPSSEAWVESLDRLPLVERQETWKQLDEIFSASERGPSPATVVLAGPTGMGRSRFLEEIRWDKQLQGWEFETFSPNMPLHEYQRKLGPSRGGKQASHSPAWIFQDMHHYTPEQTQAVQAFSRWRSKQNMGGVLLVDWNTEFGEAPKLSTTSQVLTLQALSDRGADQVLSSSGLNQNLNEEQRQSIIHHSGGRPLLLLEALRQVALEPDKTWQAPKDFTEAAQFRVKGLNASEQGALARVLAPPLPPHWSHLQSLIEAEDQVEQKDFISLQTQNFLERYEPGQRVELLTPSLKSFYWEALSKKQRQQAHQAWLDYWHTQNPGESKPSLAALAQSHHARALGDKSTFKTHALAAAETWVSLGRDTEAEETFAQYTAWAEDFKERYLVQAHLAPYYYRRGEYAKSLEAYDRWIEDRDDDESQLQKLKHRFYTGLVFFTWGKEEEATERLQEALKIGDAEAYPDHAPYLARAHLLLGRLLERQGKIEGALKLYQAASALAASSSVLLGEVQVNLGRVQRHLGHLDAAKAHFAQAQGLYHKGGNSQAEAIAFHSLALTERDQGQLGLATEAMATSLKLTEQSHAIVQEAVYQANSALLQQDLGKYREAKDLLKQSQGILSIWGKAEQQLILKLQQAHQDLLLGNRPRSQNALKELETLEETLKQERLDHALLWLRGEVEKYSGNHRSAHNYYQSLAEDLSPQISAVERLNARIAMACLEILGRPRDAAWQADPECLKQLEATPGPLFDFWHGFFKFLGTPSEERTEAQLKKQLKAISSLEFPELQKDLYHLLARDLHQSGLKRLAQRLMAKAQTLWQKIYQSLPEESKMDYDKNRSLSSLDEDLEEVLPSKKSAPSRSDTSPSGVGAQISEQRFRQLTEINRQIGKKKNLEDILERVMDASIELTGAERGFLVLKNPDAKVGPVEGYEVKTARHINQGSLKEKDFQFSMTAIQEAINQGSFVLTDNAQMDDRFQERQSVMQFQLKAILTTPLEVEGDVLGAIYLDHRFQPGCFSEEDVVVLNAFAAQAALAIEKAQILEELKQAKQQLEKKVETQAKHIDDLTGKLSQVRSELRYEYGEIIGQSPAMMKVFQLLDHVTETTIPVWIWGESGTGKELIARSLHFNSERKSGPFVSENCSAIPETLLESELFGHKKGAFTHADRDRQGLFEQASGGTLFLDEIGDMSMAMQAKLLRVLQEGEVRPVGSNKKVKVDVRLVTASHKDLNKMVSTGKFRQDLFYRVNGLSIILPPLRERLDDIPILSKHLMKKAAKEFGLKVSELTDEAYQVLYRYPWPGNIRELEGTLRNALLFAKGRPITPEFLNLNPAIAGDAPQSVPGASRGGAPTQSQAASAEDSEEKQMIMDSLRRNKLNKNKVSKDIGISLRTLYSRMEKLGIPKKKSVLAKYLGMA